MNKEKLTILATMELLREESAIAGADGDDGSEWPSVDCAAEARRAAPLIENSSGEDWRSAIFTTLVSTEDAAETAKMGVAMAGGRRVGDKMQGAAVEDKTACRTKERWKRMRR